MGTSVPFFVINIFDDVERTMQEYSDWRRELSEEVEQLDELLAGLVGAYLGAQAVKRGVPAVAKGIKVAGTRIATRKKRERIIKKARQTEVGSAERKAALKQSQQLKRESEKRVQQIKKQKPKPQPKRKKTFTAFRKRTKR